MAFTAGQRIRASDLNQIGKVVGRNSRSSNTPAVTTTETAALSVRAPVSAGRSYRVTAKFENFGGSAGVVVQDALRYTTNDVEPTTSSAQLDRVVVTCPTATIPETVSTDSLFDCTSTGYLRVLLTVVRASGTGNVYISGSATSPASLIIEDAGDIVSSSGNVY